MASAVQTIRFEHFNIASVLSALSFLLDEIRGGRLEPDFELLSCIVTYLERYPEVFHHPKEEDYLFKAMRRRDPTIGRVLDLVHDEHVRGGQMLAALRAALERYQRDPSGFSAFNAAASDYIAFERRHMAREERELLPQAMRILHEEDWAEIDAAFASNEDPLFGRNRRRDFQRLVEHILELAPSPLGFKTREAVG